ncbi:MAG: hypothetical protein Harvfovirus83_6, partial [Harvfovirus sp.]
METKLGIYSTADYLFSASLCKMADIDCKDSQE